MALQPRSQPPSRIPGGSSTDPPYGPLADSGFGNPFFYHQFADDFDNLLGPAGAYTVTSPNSGTVVHTAGDGGLALFTTGAAAGNFCYIQLPAASFTLPLTGNNPPVTANSSKKLFYLARLQLADFTAATFIAGLCSTSAAPFGGAGGTQNVVDGLFFYKAPGGTVLQLLNVASAGNSPSGSGFTNTFTIPTASYTLTNSVNIDLAFSIDPNQNLRAYVGAQLVGWIPQSGFGSVNSAGVPILPSLGPVLANYNFLSQATGMAGQTATPIMYSTAVLNMSLGVCNGVTASAKTMTADFHCAQKER
jgi:hypothetical protein